MPKMIAASGHTLIVEEITFACCNSHMTPANTMMAPMAIPTIAPPLGMPKHSYSIRLYGSPALRLPPHSSSYRSRPVSPTVYKEAPHWVQILASSGFLVPHFVQ
jgi:hypothetical protein